MSSFVLLLLMLGTPPKAPLLRTPTSATASFVLKASHIGYSLPNGWELTVDESGKGTLKFWSPMPKAASGTQTIDLTAQQLEQLKQAISKSHYSHLHKYYGALPVDYPFRRIELTRNGRTKRVEIFTLWPAEFPPNQGQDIERIIQLWSAIRACVNAGPAEAVDERPNDQAFLKALSKKTINAK